jgi:hypothetical protein
MSFVEPRIEFLCRHQNADGGWGYLPGRQSRVESTAWALRALGKENAAWGQGIQYLQAHQEKDGGFNPGTAIDGKDVSASTWVTALALPLLRQSGAETKKLEAAAEWLLQCEGAEGSLLQRMMHAFGKTTVDQDPRLRAWPWRPGNHSWVEPTSHALLALCWLDGLAPPAAIRYRRELGEKMLLDRRCVDHGWNYGNKRVLGETLPSYPETTALALLGLAASTQLDLRASLDAAQQMQQQANSAYAGSLLTLALRLHGRQVPYQPVSEAPHPSRSILIAALELLALSAEPRKALLP